MANLMTSLQIRAFFARLHPLIKLKGSQLTGLVTFKKNYYFHFPLSPLFLAPSLATT